jgi:hypothetical protein
MLKWPLRIGGRYEGAVLWLKKANSPPLDLEEQRQNIGDK